MLAKIHSVVALAGVAIMVPGIVTTVREIREMLTTLGPFLTLLSVLIFLVTVVLEARRPATA